MACRVLVCEIAHGCDGDGGRGEVLQMLLHESDIKSSAPRIEYKYFVPAWVRTQLLNDFGKFCRDDKHSEGRPGGYTVSSIYFENLALKSYQDKLEGKSSRFKLRVRFYPDAGDPDQLQIELKHKHTDRIMKSQTRTYAILLRPTDADVSWNASDTISLELQNTITGQVSTVDVDEPKTHDPDLAATITSLPAQTPAGFEPNFVDTIRELQFKLTSDNTLVIPAGMHHIEKDLFLPKGVDLVIEAGATLELAGDVSIVAFGSLAVQGRREAPVVIRAADPARPFGVIGIVGDDDSVCDISHLTLSGGRETVARGVYFSGALALHHHRLVRMARCHISDCHADDGMNIKYASVDLQDCTFENNFADQVDLDICTGLVSGCRFALTEHQNDRNGDGLDVSLSQLLVKECVFESLDDKGMSVGENSRILVEDCGFDQNHWGVAVKDSSVCQLISNRFAGNELDVFAYKKKDVWTGGKVVFVSEASQLQRINAVGDEKSVFERVRPAAVEALPNVITPESATRRVSLAMTHETEPLPVNRQEYVRE